MLNYTTSISAEKTVGEIQQILCRGRAQGMMTDMDENGRVVAISFRAQTRFGVMAFRLPCDVQATKLVIEREAAKGKIILRCPKDQREEQARRVAWRVIKDWIEAQMALIETGMATLEQVFLPYAYTPTGETVYQRLITDRVMTHHYLQIEPGKNSS